MTLPISNTFVFDGVGAVAGLLAVALFLRMVRRSPEVYRIPLFCALAGIILIVASLFVSLAAEFFGIDRKDSAEIIHHFLMFTATACFIISGWKFLTAGR